jgi:FkbM family methyltransferase
MVAPPWSRMAYSVVGTGLTERHDSLFAMDLLRPGDVFVDVGANIGFYTLIAARRGAQVEAFEPTDEAAGCCERSLAVNHLHATVHRAACGAEPGTTRFTTGLDIKNHVTTGPGIDVPVVTLDQALIGVEPTLAMFKVDAEGHDLDVLRGAMGAIERLKPVILVEVWMGGERVLELVQPHGYRSYLYDTELRSLREIPAGSWSRRNMLLIANSRLTMVRERVSNAKRPVLRPPRVSWLHRIDLAGQA